MWIAYLSTPRHPQREGVLAACTRATHLVEPAGPNGVFLGFPGKQVPAGPARVLAENLAPFRSSFIMGLGSSKLCARVITAAMEGKDPALPQKMLHIHPCPPGQIVVLPPENTPWVLAPLSINYLTCLQPQTRRRLALLGLTTFGHIAAIPAERMGQQFGPEGLIIHRLVRGIDLDPVRPLYPPRWLFCRLPLPDITGRRGLRPAMSHMAQDMAARLACHNLAAGRLVVRLSFAGAPPAGRERRFSQPQTEIPALLGALEILLPPITAPITAISAGLTDLIPVPRRQLALFTARRDGFVGIDNVAHLPLVGLKERYPHLQWGKDLPVTRREKILARLDPYRPAVTDNAPAQPAGKGGFSFDQTGQ